MFRNYVLIALRNLRKDLVHTSINVVGLALGMSSVFVIGMYINHELSYDTFHADASDLYRITWESENPQTRTPHPMAQALVSDFPEVKSAVSLSPLWAAGLTRETHAFRHPDKSTRYDEQNILEVDTSFFSVFDFPLVSGDRKTALKNPRGIIITESTAKKYFGDENPVGKFLAIDSANYLIEVTAVAKDVPVNSHFHFDFLVSYLNEKSSDPTNPYYSWKDFGHYNYIKLAPGADASALESKLMDWVTKYVDWSPQDREALRVHRYGFRLQPVTDIHLHSHIRWELEANGNADYIYLLAAAAVFTLVIGCVNFMNLSTAKSTERAKEIGVRKSMGAFRYQLAIQFLSESVITALFALVISLLFIELFLPAFNHFTGGTLNVSYFPYGLYALAGALLIGLIAGAYPALYLSGVRPQAVLKGAFTQSRGGASFRRVLTVVQFSISMGLVSSAVIVVKQLSFLQDKNLGFNAEEVVVIPVKNEEGFSRFNAMRNELLRVDGIVSVSAASNIPGHQFNQHAIALQSNPEHRIDASETFVDYDFFQALDIELKTGRFFSRSNPADAKSYVINETAARQLRSDANVIGRELVWYLDGREVRGTIIGVVGDFHFQSLHDPIRPLLFSLTERQFNHIVLKMQTKEFASKVAAIENVYKNFEPTFGFEFSFLKDNLNQQYRGEGRTAGILGVYSVIALVIACFGLFGMSMMLFFQKAKEVSIRKVLGAPTTSLLKLMLGDFTRLVLIAIAIGAPLSWYLMHEWLKNFSYQIEIGPAVFVGAGITLLVVSWSTLGYFTLKATRINPAEALKND